MRNIYLSLLLIASLSAFSQTPDSNREIKVIELSGSGYELGLQHGRLLKKEIDEIVKKMKINTTRILKKDADQVLNDSQH
jgi:isopenicillin-N N-acyltransferase like protein